MEMPSLFLWLDPYLIRLYRLTGYAYLDFFLGTLVLAFLALIIGEASASLASRAVRQQADRGADEARKYQNLSLEALKTGDRQAYTAANKLANEAFSRSFFMQIGMSGAFLWPTFLVLAWMQCRFAEVDFKLPLVDFSLSYLGVFILLYLAAYFLFKRVKYGWRRYRGTKELLKGNASIH
jgi:hypothetical protein